MSSYIPPPTGWLRYLYDRFYEIHVWFEDVHHWLEGKFILDLLAPWAAKAADLWNLIGIQFGRMIREIEDAWDTLQGRLSRSAIRELLEDLFPGLMSLIDDPVGWFLVQLTLAFDLEPYHTQSLEFLAKWVLEEYFPTLYLIWLDPDAWVEEHIAPLIPTLPDWLADPDGWLRDAVERLFPTLTEFLADPDAWLRERVLDIIREFTEDIAAFLDNAWGWLLDQYEAVFETIHARLYYLAEHTLRFFWEGEW